MAKSTILPSSSPDRLYQSSRRHPRTYSHNFFKKHFFKNFLGPFQGPRCSTPPFSNSLLALRTLRFFPNSTPRFSLRGSGGYLPPTSPLHHNLPRHLRIIARIPQSLRPSLFNHFFKNKNFQNFLGPFHCPPGLKTPIFEFPPRAT